MLLLISKPPRKVKSAQDVMDASSSDVTMICVAVRSDIINCESNPYRPQKHFTLFQENHSPNRYISE